MYHLIDYVWCVEKFSQYFEPHEIEVFPLLTSPIFSYKNTKWVLNLYPEGLGDSASQGYISLFIKYVSEDPDTMNAKVELSLLNNRNERVYCRDTGDHQYQTFIDFGYKQFLKIQDINEQKDELISPNGTLKIFARVEFEHSTMPSSITWSNYDLLLFKEDFKDLYENKNLCDIIIKVIKCPITNTAINNLNSTNQFSPSAIVNSSSSFHLSSAAAISSRNNFQQHAQSNRLVKKLKTSHHQHQADPNEIQPIEFESLEIKTHKFILASRSGKFRELLKTNLIKIHHSNKSNNYNCSNLNSKSNNHSNSNEQQVQSPNKTCSCSSEKLNHNQQAITLIDFNQHQPASSSLASSSSNDSMSSCSCLLNSNDIKTSLKQPQQLLDFNQCFADCSFTSSASSSSFSNSYLESNTSQSHFEQQSSLNCFYSNYLTSFDHDDSMSDSMINDLLIIETDRSPKVIEYLVRYMYTGYLDSFDGFAKDIYEISKEYKVHGLTNLAREHIIKELNIQNCCDYLIFCVINNDYELNNRIQTFISENYETITKTNAYKQAKRKYRELFENTFNEISKKIVH
jgi:hypothetical protein